MRSPTSQAKMLALLCTDSSTASFYQGTFSFTFFGRWPSLAVSEACRVKLSQAPNHSRHPSPKDSGVRGPPTHTLLQDKVLTAGRKTPCSLSCLTPCTQKAQRGTHMVRAGSKPQSPIFSLLQGQTCVISQHLLLLNTARRTPHTPCHSRHPISSAFFFLFFFSFIYFIYSPPSKALSPLQSQTACCLHGCHYG